MREKSASFYADHELDPQGTSLYGSYWGQFDPRREFLAIQPANRWYGCFRVCGDEAVQDSEFFQDFLLKIDVRYALCSRLAQSGDVAAMIAVLRPPGSESFAPEDERLLSRYTAHLQRAAKIQLRLGEAAARVKVLEGLVHAMAQPVIVVNGSAQVRFLNRAAERIVSAVGSALTVRMGRLISTSVDTTNTLRKIVTNAANEGRGGALNIKPSPGQGSLGEELSAMVAPLSPNLRLMGGENEPLALVFLSVAPATSTELAGVFHALYGFTPAEIKLAAALIAGKSIEEFALSQQIGISTVRTQLSSLFSKTGTKRQGELIALLGLGRTIPTLKI
jgi:DNA-binding CsgD family transcriptional regulator